MFGSCFIENCLETRSYTLSTGVTSRGTPGSYQLLQVQRSIQVTVNVQAAPVTVTFVHANVQVHLRFDVSAIRAAFGRWIERVSQENLTTVPLTFVYQLPPEFVKTHIRNRLCQMMVLQHAAHVQVFQHDCRLGFRQQTGSLMQGILANVGDPQVRPGQLPDRFQSVGTPFLSPGNNPLQPPDLS